MEDEKGSADNNQGESTMIYETDGSFVHRIGNATSNWSRSDSEKHSIGGLRWFLSAYREVYKHSVFLQCYLCFDDDVTNTTFSCCTKFTLVLLSMRPEHNVVRNLEGQFHSGSNNELGTPELIEWKCVLDKDKGFLVEDAITLSVSIKITECTGIIRMPQSTFDSPLFSDVTLIVEDKRIYVGKQVLAMHCRFFATLFFGAFSETGKSEFRLSEVVHDEFIDFLRVLYPERKEVDFGNVRHLLKLADRFGCPVVLALCTKYLLKTDEIDVAEKLYFADKYYLTALLNECLKKLAAPNSLHELSLSPDFATYSEPLLRTLSQRARQLRGIECPP